MGLYIKMVAVKYPITSKSSKSNWTGNQQWCYFEGEYIDGLVHDCSNSIAVAMELLQFCTEPSICIQFFLHMAFAKA